MVDVDVIQHIQPYIFGTTQFDTSLGRVAMAIRRTWDHQRQEGWTQATPQAMTNVHIHMINNQQK